MHIVVSTKAFFPIVGGSIVYASMLAEEFSKAGHKVTLITRTPGDDLPNTGYQLLRQPSVSNLLHLASRTDVLMQIESSWQDAIPFLLNGVPWFPTVHRGCFTGPLSAKGKLRLALERMAYRLGHTIGVSSYVVDAWKLKEPAIPNPYDERIFHEPTPGSGREIDILFVGSIVRHKGIFVLTEALGLLAPAKGELKVAFIGEGADSAELSRALGELPPSIECVLAGRQTPDEVAQWMKRSRILAFPTTPDWLEASPLTPLEAAACGCLIVASDSGGTPENVSSDHWIVKSGSVTELSDALLKALRKPSEPMGAATRQMLDQRCLQRIASRYLSRFTAAIARPLA